MLMLSECEAQLASSVRVRGSQVGRSLAMDEEALRLDLEERVGEAWGDVDMEGNGILDADEIAQVPSRSLSLSLSLTLAH